MSFDVGSEIPALQVRSESCGSDPETYTSIDDILTMTDEVVSSNSALQSSLAETSLTQGENVEPGVLSAPGGVSVDAPPQAWEEEEDLSGWHTVLVGGRVRTYYDGGPVLDSAPENGDEEEKAEEPFVMRVPVIYTKTEVWEMLVAVATEYGVTNMAGWLKDTTSTNHQLVDRLAATRRHQIAGSNRKVKSEYTSDAPRVDGTPWSGGNSKAKEAHWKGGASNMKMVHSSKKDLKSNPYWKVPEKNPRKRVYQPPVAGSDPRLFRDWILTWAYKLRQAHPNASRAEGVIGNGSAEVVFRAWSKVPGAFLQQEVLKAYLWWDTLTVEVSRMRVPRKTNLWHLMKDSPEFKTAGRSITVCGSLITNVGDLEQMSTVFRRDKPVFRTARAYLLGEDVDVPRLETSLAQIGMRKQGSDDMNDSVIAYVASVLMTTSDIGEEMTGMKLLEPIDLARLLPQAIKLAALYSLLKSATCWSQVTAALLLYASDTPLASKCAALAIQYGGELFTFQGLEDGEGGFLNWGIAKLDAIPSHLMDAMCALFAALAGATVVPSEKLSFVLSFSSDMTKEVVSAMRKTGIKKLGESLVETLSKFLQRLTLCVRERSFAPLLSSRNSPTLVLREAEQILTYMAELVDTGASSDGVTARIKELRVKGMIPDFVYIPYSPSEFGNLLVDYVQQIEKLQAMFTGSSVAIDLSRMKTRLYTALAQESGTSGSSARRIQPLGLLMFGGAGAGKTGLARDTADMLGSAEGYEIDDASYYEWQPNDNFQSNLGNRQWCIFMQDIDTTVAQPTAGVMNHVEASMKIIDNKPFPVEQAAIDLKGKICSRPLLVLQTTNFPFGRVRGFTLQPDAFYRRYPIMVEVIPKAEYCVTGGKALNGDLAAVSPDMEIHDLLVYELDPSMFDNPNKTPPYKAARKMSRAGFFAYIVAKYRKHMASQKRYINATRGIIPCETCFSLRQCVHRRVDVVGQGGYIPVAVAGVGALVLAQGVRRIYRSPLVSAYLDTFGSLPRNVNRIVSRVNAILDSVETVETKVARYLEWLPTAKQVALLSLTGLVVAGVYKWQKRSVVAQGRTDNSVEGLPDQTWRRARQEFVPGLPSRGVTYTLEELLKVTQENMVVVRGAVRVQGCIWGHNLISTVSHAIPVDGEMMQIVSSGVTYSVKVQRGLNVIELGWETVLVKVPSLVGRPSIASMLWTVDESVSDFDEVRLITSERVETCVKAKMKRLPHVGLVISHKTETFDGECGGIYIARIGKGWRIVAQHAVMWESTIFADAAYGGPILNYLDMMAGASGLSSILQGVEIPRSQVSLLKDQGFAHFPAKSEVWTAVTQQGVEVVPYGTAVPQIHGATMKTSFMPTLHAEEFRDLERDWCGESPYWMPPAMTGEMRNGLWKSPFSNMFTYINRMDMDYEYAWLALIDYLLPFEHCDTSGYRPVSAEEVIRGIPNSHIWGVDMKTSVGPPFNRKKKDFMVVKDNMVFLEKNFWDLMEEYREVSRFAIPSPLALVTLKDEVVSVKKVRDLDTRTFECMTAAHNVVSSEACAPINCFIRDNVKVSECYVGVNMTSPEATKLVEAMKVVNPELDRLLAEDVKKLDKVTSGMNLDFVALIYFYLGFLLGVSPLDAYKSIQAVRNTTYCAKNDLFALGVENPSGNSNTVQINSLGVSHTQRLVYYKMKYPNGLPEAIRLAIRRVAATFWLDPVESVREFTPAFVDFRKLCSLATYGDDSLKAVSRSAKFYDPSKIQELYLKHVGWTVTDELKRDVINWCVLADVAFLKRNFVWDAELGYYLTPLSKKTLVKMLVARTRSTLGDKDHSATLLTDVMREAAYHGELMYRMLYARVMDVAVRYDYLGNSYFQVPMYHQVRAKMCEGNFQTWRVVPERGDPGLVEALSTDADHLLMFGLTQALNEEKNNK